MRSGAPVTAPRDGLRGLVEVACSGALVVTSR